MPESAAPKRFVIALGNADLASRRRMLEGIARYAQRSANWDLLCITQHVTAESMGKLMSLADGVLATAIAINAPELQKLKCPWVALGEDLPGAYCVVADDHAVGAMAMEHFASLGLRHVAYCGIANVPFSEARAQGLATRAKQMGASFHHYPRMVYFQMDNDPHEVTPFHQWLRTLPKPVGLLATTCETAHAVIHHCRRLQLSVPDQIAILGVDEDELLCEITRPHLSTIDQAADEIGYRAAALLDQLFAGQGPLDRQITIAPRRVVPRESTDLVSSDSALIAKALRYTREHAHKGITVPHILKKVPISRRALERGFKRNIGRTVHQEILRLRLERAKELLAETDLKTNHVAERCGFHSPSMLCNVFRRELQISPREYRRAVRLGGSVASNP